MMDEQDDVTYLQSLIDSLGGPPPGIDVGSRGFAVATEIYDVPMSASRAASMMECFTKEKPFGGKESMGGHDEKSRYARGQGGSRTSGEDDGASSRQN